MSAVLAISSLILSIRSAGSGPFHRGLIIGTGRNSPESAYSWNMTPCTVIFEGEENFRKVELAKDQPEYLTLPALVSADEKAVLVRYKLSEEELCQLRKGGSLFVMILTGGKPVQPQMLFVEDHRKPDTARKAVEDWKQFVY